MSNLGELIKNLTQAVDLNNKALKILLDNLASLIKRVEELERRVGK